MDDQKSTVKITDAPSAERPRIEAAAKAIYESCYFEGYSTHLVRVKWESLKPDSRKPFYSMATAACKALDGIQQ